MASRILNHWTTTGTPPDIYLLKAGVLSSQAGLGRVAPSISFKVAVARNVHKEAALLHFALGIPRAS